VAGSGRDEHEEPIVIGRRVEYGCPWFEVVVKDVRYPKQEHARPFYAVEIDDFTTVLAVDQQGRIPLVRQYRPVVERFELELPAGAVHGASPDEAARRELLEETGHEAGELLELGSIFAEVGRLTSRAWLYFAPGARRVAEPTPPLEEPLELVLVTQAELFAAIRNGEFAVGSHVAAVGLALVRGLVELPRSI
jgi:8-oxo-dGTP pyrophosphatase MutT (NUDIX family)